MADIAIRMVITINLLFFSQGKAGWDNARVEHRQGPEVEPRPAGGRPADPLQGPAEAVLIGQGESGEVLIGQGESGEVLIGQDESGDVLIGQEESCLLLL